jgi:hypothetical protein
LNAEGGRGKASATEGPRPSNETIGLVLDGCLYALLGGPASSAFRSYVKRQSSATIAELVDDPQKLQGIVEAVFGDSAAIIEDFMVKSLVREFNLPASLCVDFVSTLKIAKS